MSLFMQTTLKVDPYQLPDLMAALSDLLFPLMEEQGWVLHGCFVKRFGPVKPCHVVDLWEVRDMAHVESVMRGDAYRSDPRYQQARAVLVRAVQEETLEFMEKRLGRIRTVYG